MNAKPQRPIQENDMVVLPSGRRALVVRRLEDGRIDCAPIVDGRPNHDEAVALQPRLLRRIERGIVPPPVQAA